MINVDRGDLITEMKARKIQNSKTSISFGQEKVDYISDTQFNLNKCIGVTSPAERATQATRIKEMKKALTKTNFCLGDESVEYLTNNQAAMSNVKKHDTNGAKQAFNGELLEAIKRSSISFGHEKPDYQSVAHEAMQPKGAKNDFAGEKARIQQMIATLRKHNFTLGDERVDYTSDYTSGFGNLPIEAYFYAGQQRPVIRATINDNRACHFSLGHDQIKYESNTASALNFVASQANGSDVKLNLENAKKMKAALQKTSICIGDDVDYM